MKKLFILSILIAFSISSIIILPIEAQSTHNRSLFIDGSSIRNDHLEYFFVNFRKEAVGMGIPVVNNREEAGFIFKFDVQNNPLVQEDGNQFRILISLINNANNYEILSFSFYYNSLNEMYEHNQFIFFRAVSVIPPVTEDALVFEQTSWKYKWLYLRASFDYPVNFYQLQPDGLIGGGVAVYKTGTDGITPDELMPLDHRIFALPGFTLGAEFHFLNFLSTELQFKGNFGDSYNNIFLNLAVGAQIKFSIKFFRLFVISPYIGGYIPIVKSDIFTDYPEYTLGGGIQLNTKGGKNGSFFVDVNYMITFSDAVMINPYILFPNPDAIHYRPSFLDIGIGYKHGFFNRSRRFITPCPCGCKSTTKCNCGCSTNIPSAEIQEEIEESQSRRGRERNQNEQTFYF